MGSLESMKKLIAMFCILFLIVALLAGCSGQHSAESIDTRYAESAEVSVPSAPDTPVPDALTPDMPASDTPVPPHSIAPSSPDKTGAEYIKITAEEAQAMMSDDVIILDVRSQEEFDSVHIRNAILLPGNRLRDEAADTILNKDQIILVYCRTGIRSEIAAKELIDMGYTKVFDFGGINDWTGEIIWDAIGTSDFDNFFTNIQ